MVSLLYHAISLCLTLQALAGPVRTNAMDLAQLRLEVALKETEQIGKPAPYRYFPGLDHPSGSNFEWLEGEMPAHIAQLVDEVDWPEPMNQTINTRSGAGFVNYARLIICNNAFDPLTELCSGTCNRRVYNRPTSGYTCNAAPGTQCLERDNDYIGSLVVCNGKCALSNSAPDGEKCTALGKLSRINCKATYGCFNVPGTQSIRYYYTP